MKKYNIFILYLNYCKLIQHIIIKAFKAKYPILDPNKLYSCNKTVLDKLLWTCYIVHY